MAFEGKSIGEIFESLPDDLHEMFVSVSCLNLIMTWIELNVYFKDLAINEMKRRFRLLDQAIIKMGLRLEDFPFEVSFCDFREDVDNIIQIGNKIEIHGMKMTLRFLRHFGNDIKFLNCNFYGASEEQTTIIFNYITNYCTELTKLYFGFLRHSLKYSLRKCFENVTALVFSNCRLDNELCKLNLYFPRVNEISFYERNEFQDLSSVIERYSYLSKMLIERDSMDILSVALLQAINPRAIVNYLGSPLRVVVLDLNL